MPRKPRASPATAGRPTIFIGIPILHARKKGQNVPAETEDRNVLGRRIYKKEGNKKVWMRDPKPYHAEQVKRRADKKTRPFDKRYICYISGCNWGVNNGACEARDHFRGGYHNMEIYDVKMVIEVDWDDWLDDEDLKISAAATSRAEWYEAFNARNIGTEQEEVEQEEVQQDDGEQMDVDQVDPDQIDLEE